MLRFEVAADTFATFREATQRLAREGGGRLDDDALLLAMARHVLGGPKDTGRSSYQISLDLCPRCGRGAQLAAGELVPVDAAIVDMATCDAQHLGERLPDGALTFRHADGSTYGAPAAPQPIDAFAKVFSALRQLGFREGEVQAVLGELRGDPAVAGVSVGRLLREALCRIKPVAR